MQLAAGCLVQRCVAKPQRVACPVPTGPAQPIHHCGGCAAAVVDGLGRVTPCRHELLPLIFHSYCW